jgi:hypothetical protein
MKYKAMIGGLDGFIKITQFIQPFSGNLVTEPGALGKSSVAGLFAEQEVLTIVFEIPEENVDYFESLTTTLGWLGTEELERYEPVLETA